MFVIPKISEQEAKNIFSDKKKFSPSKFKKIPHLPERLEIIYLPFYLFDVSVKKEDKDRQEMSQPMQKVTLSVDGLLGHSVLFAIDDLAVSSEKKARFCEFELPVSEAEKIAMSEYKVLLLEYGLRTRSFSQTEKISNGWKIFYPFWIAYFRKRKGYDFKALDAVSGEIQGIKMRKIFMRAFRLMT